MPVNGTLSRVNHEQADEAGFFGAGVIRPDGAEKDGDFFYAGNSTDNIIAQVSYADDYFTFSADGNLQLVQ